MNEEALSRLGQPNIKLQSLRIWVHGRQFPHKTDFWDGNWLQVTVDCTSKGAEVTINGPLIHLSELEAWLTAAEKLHTTMIGEANLDCMEPELKVKLVGNKLGKIFMTVDITPDNVFQQHIFRSEIDQSYLPELIAECRGILASYPIRSPNDAYKGDDDDD